MAEVVALEEQRLVEGLGEGVLAAAAADAYAQAGVEDPRAELALAEVHDCFTPTELVLMEDLGFSARGQAWKDCEAGVYDIDGE